MELPRIKVFIMDVDGVLTDGRIGYGCGSDDEIKFFNVKDGLGITLLHRCGIVTAVISGRRSLANIRRLTELKVTHVIESCKDKSTGIRELCAKLGVTPNECLYIGDDLIDLPAMRLAGISVAVGDAVPEVKANATWVMKHKGGRGAVREAAERLLKTQGLWDKATEVYYQ
jgi:3-deoxy-D-manno-octulosonate 8-phosphate phosphatase (KDO 8-P phosphatase)